VAQSIGLSRNAEATLSGASLDRPALQELLDDVRARKVDIIVVYKVDRLTRSLDTDFAKLVELFDQIPGSGMAGVPIMPAHTHPYAGLIIVFERDGAEIERQTARDGERAAQMAALLIARLGTLQAGDVMTVEEA
jgi:Resolvase, N terminal domain